MSKNTVIGGGFHHVAIKVSNFDAVVDFYKKLGFTEKISWGEGDERAVMLDTGDGNYVEVFAGGKPGPTPDGIIHFAIRTPDVDAAHKLALELGAVETMAPKSIDIKNTSKAGGLPLVVPVRISFFRGLGGEIVEFFQNELT
ncbi:MAG TPA: VOC family protein [Candidatus Methylacidiphilales bacterium]